MWRTVVVVVALAGCKGGGQHCVSSDGTSCVEIHNLGSLGILGAGTGLTIAALCTAIGADSSPGACPEEGRVGGCRSEDGTFETITWSYDGTLDDLSCASDEELLGPDGAPVEVVVDTDPPSVCSTDGGEAVTVTFANGTSSTVSLYWVDTGCAESWYGTNAAGASFDQPTYVNHAWRVRLGDMNPTGLVLWEGAVTEAGTIPVQ